jgi:hypothetical protein
MTHNVLRFHFENNGIIGMTISNYLIKI